MESSTSTTRLAFQQRAVGAVLQLHAQVADAVGRLDEGAADIVVADDAEFERQPPRRVADRRRHAAVRHRHHDIRTPALARQLGADALAHVVDGVPSTTLSGRAK
jgi:hypothetical protein